LPIDPSTAFVSYSRDDLEFVVRLAKDLKAKGAKVWMDRLDIRPGQRWEVEIESAVNGCSRLLVILSPAAIASRNVLAEAALALDEGKEVIPVLHQECKIPFRLRPLQYADFSTSYAVGLEELLAVLIGGHETPPSAAAEPPRPGEGPQQTHTEQVRREQEEHKRRAAEDRTNQEEIERQRLAAERARLEEERREFAAEKTRLEQAQRERIAAEERARQEELEHRRAAGEQARLEDERKETPERKAIAMGWLAGHTTLIRLSGLCVLFLFVGIGSEELVAYIVGPSSYWTYLTYASAAGLIAGAICTFAFIGRLSVTRAHVCLFGGSWALGWIVMAHSGLDPLAGVLGGAILSLLPVVRLRG
jgi:hypothetical protein